MTRTCIDSLSKFGSLPALFLLLFLFSGCMGLKSASNAPMLGSQDWHATYAVDTPDAPIKGIDVTYMGGPFTVLNNQGSVEAVSRFEVTLHFDKATRTTAFDVDSMNRVLRSASLCGLSDCTKSGFKWFEHRVLPPWGMSLPDYVHDGKLELLQGIANSTMDVTMSQSGTMATWSVEDPHWPMEVASEATLSSVYPVGTFVYAQKDLRAPTEFTAVPSPGQPPIHAIRNSFKIQETLVPKPLGAHFNPKLPSGGGRDLNTLLVPGEDQALPGSQQPMRAALDYLLSNVAEAKQILGSGGCVSSVQLFPDQGTRGTPAGLLDTKDTFFYFTFSEQNGSTKEWHVRYESSKVGQPSWSSQNVATTDKFLACRQARNSPPLIHFPKLFIEAVNLTGHDTYSQSSLRIDPHEPMELDGWLASPLRYGFSFMPAGTDCTQGCSFHPQEIQFDSRTGHLLQAYVSQSDYALWGN
jgi:hypothetical protein